MPRKTDPPNLTVIKTEQQTVISSPVKYASHEIGQALKALCKLDYLPCTVHQDPDANTKAFHHSLPGSQSLRITHWEEYLKQNKKRLSQSLLRQLKSVLFFRFLIGFAVTRKCVAVIEQGDHKIAFSLREGRFSQRKQLTPGEFQQSGSSCVIHGKVNPLSSLSGKKKQADFYEEWFLVDAQSEMRRILGNLSRLTFDSWLEQVQQVIKSIDPKYTWLVGAMRDRVLGMVEFEEEHESQARMPHIKVEDDPQLPRPGKWTRTLTSGKPQCITRPKGAPQWQTSEQYPELECSVDGDIRVKQTKERLSVRVYEDKPFILPHRKKIRADKLIWQAFSNDEQAWSKIRVYPQNGDPSNIALENLQNIPVKERKPRSKPLVEDSSADEDLDE